jgi:DNA-binding response OmpR family regulator
MQGKQILVIDDDPHVLRMVRLILSNEGAQIHTAANGMEGLTQFYAHRPDLVILDVMMPEIDGWGTCARLRQLSDVPILMLSALGGDGHIVRGLKCGADDYMSKPFADDVLIARVKALLRRAPVSSLPAQ